LLGSSRVVQSGREQCCERDACEREYLHRFL
jgi:hypothetical protein